MAEYATPESYQYEAPPEKKNNTVLIIVIVVVVVLLLCCCCAASIAGISILSSEGYLSLLPQMLSLL